MDAYYIRERVIFHLQNIVNNVIIVHPDTFEPLFKEEKSAYPRLSNEHFNRIKFRGLCGTIAQSFLSCMKKEGITASFVFAYAEPVEFIPEKARGFNKRFLDAVLKRDFVEATFINRDVIEKAVPRHLTRRRTHALVEILIGTEKYLADPMAGLLYCTGKEDLLRGKGIYESYSYLDQQSFLSSNIQIDRHTLFFTSPIFWESVYHISYDAQGGLPVKSEVELFGQDGGQQC